VRGVIDDNGNSCFFADSLFLNQMSFKQEQKVLQVGFASWQSPTDFLPPLVEDKYLFLQFNWKKMNCVWAVENRDSTEGWGALRRNVKLYLMLAVQAEDKL